MSDIFDPQGEHLEYLSSLLPPQCRNCKPVLRQMHVLSAAFMSSLSPEEWAAEVDKRGCTGTLSDAEVDSILPQDIVFFTETGGAFGYLEKLKIVSIRCPFLNELE